MNDMLAQSAKQLDSDAVERAAKRVEKFLSYSILSLSPADIAEYARKKEAEQNQAASTATMAPASPKLQAELNRRRSASPPPGATAETSKNKLNAKPKDPMENSIFAMLAKYAGFPKSWSGPDA